MKATTMKYTMNLIRALVLASAGLLPLSVQAHYIQDKCLRNPGGSALNEPVNFPAITLNSGRDVPVGEAFGPWFKHTLTWTCTRTTSHDPKFSRDNDYFHTRSWVYPIKKMEDRGLYAADPSFRVYSFKKDSSVGFIAKVIRQVKNGQHDTFSLNTKPGLTQENEKELKGSVARKVGDVSEFQLELQIRLVKLDGKPTTETLHFPAIEVQFFSSKYHQGGNINLWDRFPPHSKYLYSLTTTVKTIKATCKTSNGNTIEDQIVQLDTVPAHALITRGFGPDTPFKLHFRDCPPAMTAIHYAFQPLPGGTSPVNGILPQMAVGSTAATGAGVQVRDENNQPINFGLPLPLSAYNPNATGPASYAVPLTARIHRTHGPLTGGSVEAAMNVEVTYQ